jgi:GTPase
MTESLLNDIRNGDMKALSRGITLLVNSEQTQFENDLPDIKIPVIGITGPPGAGKSTLTDKLIAQFVRADNTVAVLCVDPSSPFTNGAILGDRIRMSEWYDHPQVFIRSLATRGSLGGLPAKAAAIINLVKQSTFDVIIVETVGVGQNEIEIASLSDVTVVVLVPESGDDIQFMKAGLMEIGDIFVVNKSDRPGADQFANEIKQSANNKIVVKTIANTNVGVGELFSYINEKIYS